MVNRLRILEGWDWRYFGLALLVPTFITFRRISFSLPVALSKEVSAYVCIIAFILGAVFVLIGLLFMSSKNSHLRQSQRVIISSILFLCSFSSMFFILATEINQFIKICFVVVAYFTLSSGLIVCFLSWLHAYSEEGTPKLMVYVSIAILLGNIPQAWLNKSTQVWAVGSFLFVLLLLSNAILISLERSSKEKQAKKAVHFTPGERNKEDEWSLYDTFALPVTATSLAFCLPFFTWGVLSVPPERYAQDHNFIVQIIGPALAVLVMLLLFSSLRKTPGYAAVRQKAYFLLPVFVIFLAYFSFVRMLDSTGELKLLLSIGYNMSTTGLVALFITLTALQHVEKGISIISLVAPVLLAGTLMYALGTFCHHLLGNNAMYVQIVLSTLYLLGLSLFSIRKASLNDDKQIEQRCSTIAEDFGLSAREKETLLLLADDYSVARIADHFVISPETVRTHKKRIYSKLDVHKHEELMRLIRKGEKS